MYNRGTGTKNTSGRELKPPTREGLIAAATKTVKKFAQQYTKTPSATNALLVELATRKLVEVLA